MSHVCREMTTLDDSKVLPSSHLVTDYAQGDEGKSAIASQPAQVKCAVKQADWSVSASSEIRILVAELLPPTDPKVCYVYVSKVELCIIMITVILINFH